MNQVKDILDRSSIARLLNTALLATKLVLLLAVTVYFSCKPTPFVKKGKYFVQVYDFTQLDNIAVVNQLAELEVSDVILSVNPRKLLPSGSNPDADYTNKVADFLRTARAGNISGHLLILQEAFYTFRKNHVEAGELVGYLLDFCRANSGLKVAGLVIDVEPFTLDEWKKTSDWSKREVLMGQYLELLAQLHEQIKGGQAAQLGLNFSAYVAYWFNDRSRTGLLPSGNAALLGQYLDMLLPMSYDTDPSLCDQVRDEVELAPTLPTLKAQNFNSYREIQAAMQGLDDCFLGHANYVGVNIFQYARLVERL